MMKRLAAACLLACLGTTAFAESKGYQQSTSLSTSGAINLPSIPTSAQSVVIDIEGAGIRFRDDGTDPTSTVGRPISAGQSLCYTNDPHAIRMIGQTAGATVNATYYAGTCR